MMTQPAHYSSALSPPTPAQLALGLLVLRSKPPDLNLNEYILQLRKCVQVGIQPPAKYFDSCAFWKHSYERSETARSALLNELYERDQQIERLRSDICPPKAADIQAGVKRKRSVNHSTKQSKDCKRLPAKVKKMRIQEEDKRLEETEIEFDGGEEFAASTTFAAAIFALRQCLSAKQADGNILLMSLTRVCAAADEILTTTTKLSLSSIAKTEKAAEAARIAFGNLMGIPDALRICYPSLLQGIGKLFFDQDGAGNGIFSVVQLFEHILGHLHAISAFKAETAGTGDGSLDQCQPRSIGRQISAESDLHELCLAFTKLAIHFFEELDLSKPSHNRLCEGLVSVFLEHLGSTLSLIVFADVNVATSECTTIGVRPPRGLLDTSDLEPRAALRATEHETVYLVAVLRHLMCYLDKPQPLLGSGSSPPLIIRDPSDITKSTFVASVHERLQATLLRGVFGDDDESFKSALQRPVADVLGVPLDLPSDDRKSASEEFIGEVWKVLGWNILTGASALSSGRGSSLHNHW